MKRCAAIAVLILSACASSDTKYYPTGMAPPPSPIADRDTGRIPLAVNDAQAESALLYAILDTVFPGPEKKGSLWGQCRVKGVGAPNIYTPCHNVEIALVTDDGREIASTRTDEGRFIFSVEAKKRYRLKLKSKLYNITSDQVGPYTGGNKVTIDLNPMGT